jgi:hypothetical protein
VAYAGARISQTSDRLGTQVVSRPRMRPSFVSSPTSPAKPPRPTGKPLGGKTGKGGKKTRWC